MAVSYIWFNIVDEKGDKSRVEIPFPSTTPVADLVAGVQGIADLINPLVSGGLDSAGVSVGVSVSGWSAVAASGSDVQEKMKSIIRTAGGFLKTLRLPTFLEAFLVSGSPFVDRADTDVAAFETFLESGIDTSGAGGSGVIAPSDYREDDLDAVEVMIEDWGKARS